MRDCSMMLDSASTTLPKNHILNSSLFVEPMLRNSKLAHKSAFETQDRKAEDDAFGDFS